MKTDISIIIPAYNEEDLIENTINDVVRYLSDKNYIFEIIVINDGSKDRTYEILKKMSENYDYLKVINHQVNEGKGKSVKDGVILAKNKNILFTDADLSAPITNLENMLKEIHKGYDIVIASREVEGSEIKKRPLHRKIMGRVFNKIITILGFQGIKDTQCGFKLFNAKTAKDIFSKSKINGYAFDVEILHIARLKGYKIKEYPVLWIDRLDSKMKIIRDALKMLKEVIKIKYYDKKGYYR